MTDEKVRTYEITMKHGTVRVDIPETYKVTFGPIAGAKGYEGGGFAFRAWESDTKQRMLLTNVLAFRDLSLPAQILAVRKFGTDEWFRDDGSWKGKRAEQVERAWMPVEQVAADPPIEEPMQDEDEDVLTYPRAKSFGKVR